MASIKKRTVTWKIKDGLERSKVTWRARYRDRDGEEHEQKFDRRVDAQTWLDEATADLRDRAIRQAYGRQDHLRGVL